MSPSASPSAKYFLTFSASGGESVDLEVEIAGTPEERSRGLMFRETLGENSGMFFLYEDDHQGGFWMKDTLVPLSIAFLLQDGAIIDILDMEPGTTDLHRPMERYRNAVEVNQGWFDRNHIAVGDVVELPVGLGQ